jgi:hypothetical protein
MAKGWTCGRCAAENEESAVSCRSCGLIRGGVIAAPNPIAPLPPSAQPPTPQPSAGTRPNWAAPASSATAGAPPPPAGYPAPAQPTSSAPPPPGTWSGAPIAQAETSPRRRAARLPMRLIVIVAIVAIGGAVSWFTNAGRDSSGQINHAGDLAATDLQVGDCYDLPGNASAADPSAAIDKVRAIPCTEPHHYEVFFSGSMPDSGTYPTQADFQAYVDTQCAAAFQSYVGTPVDQTSLAIYWFYPDQAAWGQSDRSVQCSLADPHLKTLTKSMKASGY